ncbi:MAG: ferredoxin--NADP reductase [Oleiphilaceae bacterium]|nr:ferredoxin--NADP reductase [Oleiphilaceae bacterium]
MSKMNTEKVTSVHHWNETLFSFTTTRDPGFRFKNGHFTMIGLEAEGKPLMRAYSMASANYEEQLEFFSIKVPDGPLTSRLQKIEVGDEILVSRKPTGTLVADHLLPGRNLYLLSTGTGLAPFMSIIKDPEIYEQFDKVILTHGVRYVSELAYQDEINDLPNNEFFGEMVQGKLVYYPTVTREEFRNQGRLTDLMESGKLMEDLGMPPAFDLEQDRFMICGSPGMLKDTTAILNRQGFLESRHGDLGHFVIERAFVEK